MTVLIGDDNFEATLKWQFLCLSLKVLGQKKKT